MPTPPINEHALTERRAATQRIQAFINRHHDRVDEQYVRGLRAGMLLVEHEEWGGEPRASDSGPSNPTAPAVDDDLLRKIGKIAVDLAGANTVNTWFTDVGRHLLASEPMQRVRAAWTAEADQVGDKLLSALREAEAAAVRQAFDLVKLRADNASLRAQVDGRLRDNDVAAEALKKAWRERDEARVDFHRVGRDLERVRLAFRGSPVDLHPEADLAEGVGEALARVTVARAELDELRVERDNAIGYRDEALNLRRAMQGERDAARSQRNESDRRVAGLIQRAEEAEQQRDNLRAEVDELTDEQERLQAERRLTLQDFADTAAELEDLRAAVPDFPDDDYSTWNRNRYFMVDNLHEVVRSRQEHPFDDYNRGYEMGISWSLLRMGVTEAGSPERETQLKPWLEAHRGDIVAAAADATTALPTAPGSVILDREGDAFQLVKVAHGEDLWRSHASRSDFKASERAFQNELMPVTVVHDAGADASPGDAPLAQWELDLLTATTTIDEATDAFSVDLDSGR